MQRKKRTRKRINFVEKVKNNPSSYMNGKYPLRDFQTEAVAFLIQTWRSILALPTGLGKSYSSLSAYTYLKDRIPELKLLYISEKSILPQTAYEDLPKFFDDLSVSLIYENSIKQREKIYNEFIKFNNDVLFMNYHTLKNDIGIVEDLFRMYKFLIIFDEADNISGNSQMSATAGFISKLAYRVWALTASPSRSNLEHIYNIFTNIGNKQISVTEFRTQHCIIENKQFGNLSINGKKVGNLFGQPMQIGTAFMGSFRKLIYEAKYYNRMEIKQNLQKGKLSLFDKQKMTFKLIVPSNFIGRDYFIVVLYNDKKKKKKQLNIQFSCFPNTSVVGYKNISKFVEKTKNSMFVRSKKQVAKDIPPFTVHKLYLKEDKTTFNKISSYYYEVDVTSSAKINIALSMPQLLELDNDIEIDYYYANEKIKEAKRIIVKSHFEGEKVIIYTPYRTVIERFIEILLKDKIIKKGSYAIVTGAVKGAEKTKAKESFVNDPRCNVMFITDAGLKGLNLQVANNLILLNMPKTGSDLIQLAGRISRIGTTFSFLNIYILMQEATNDVDMYKLIFGQIGFIYMLNPDLVDAGLYQPELDRIDEKKADIFIARSLSNRKAKYLKG